MIVRATKTSLVLRGVPIKDKKFEKETKNLWHELMVMAELEGWLETQERYTTQCGQDVGKVE